MFTNAKEIDDQQKFSVLVCKMVEQFLSDLKVTVAEQFGL